MRHLKTAFILTVSLPAIGSVRAQGSRLADDSVPPSELLVMLGDGISKSENHFVCANIVLLEGVMSDSPDYFFTESPRKLISICGGSCMVSHAKWQQDMCSNPCPPPKWRANGCDEERREYEKLARERAQYRIQHPAGL